MPPDRIAAILSTLQPHEVEDCLTFLRALESSGNVDPEEAAEWRRQILERAAKFAPGTDEPQ